ncbi:MAG: hypothetical protein V4510_02465 [bacterium]
MDAKPWYRAIWHLMDESMRRWSERLQRIVRLLRLARFLLVVGILAILGSAIVGLFWPKYFPYAYAVATVFLVVPLILLVVLAGLPLRARSVVRLIDMGYPANAREMAIRMIARKLHDESIATEELLWDTAVNEGRKFIRKVEERKSKDDDGATMEP